MANDTDSVITELVQIPLRVPYKDFIDVFVPELEPILLSQPGLISVMTGHIIGAQMTDDDGNYAVSLTQWESMEAHSAFLASPSAGPFFQRLQPLITGPPNVEHYRWGRFKLSALASRYVHVRKSSGRDDSLAELKAMSERHTVVNGQEAVAIGSCMEADSQIGLVLFANLPLFNTVADARTSEHGTGSFTVFLARSEVKKVPQSL